MKDFRFSLFKSSILMNLDIYKEHAKKIEAFLADELKEFEAYAQKVTDGWPEYERTEYYENASDRYWELGEVFPTIQRKSELISLYTILEHNLIKVCSFYETIIDNPVKISDLEAKGIIDQARKYLTKVACIEFPKTHTSWQELLMIQQIRNSFVHADGYIKSSNKVLVEYIRSSPYLDLDERFKSANRFEITIKAGFTSHCAGVLGVFFNELFTKIQESKKYNKALNSDAAKSAAPVS